jgi:hypothetical protein
MHMALSLKPACWTTKKDVPEGLDWSEQTIVLWEEDECLRHDRTAEHICDAVVRLCGTMYDCAKVFKENSDGGVRRQVPDGQVADPIKRLLGDEIDKIDGGDCFYKLYRWGWVICDSYDGSSLLRVMLEEKR